MQPFVPCPAIIHVVEEIREIANPDQIIVFNLKRNLHDEITSFKLCVVAPTTNKTKLEHALYLQIDCDLPYDILVYTPGEWARLTADPLSFAHKIQQSGCVVYG